MKNKLLLTTALVSITFVAVNVYAQERPTYYTADLTQKEVDPVEGGGMSNVNSVLNSGTVLEGGKTTISNAGLTFTDVLGKPNVHDNNNPITEDTTNLDGSKIDLNKTGTFTMSGGDLTLNDVEVAADKTIIMTGGILSATNTNVEAKGDISLITDQQLTLNTTNISSEKSITFGGNVNIQGQTTWKADNINFNNIKGTINSESLNIIANSEGKNPNLTFVGQNTIDRIDGHGLDVYGANITVNDKGSFSFTQNSKPGTMTIHDVEGSSVTNNGTMKTNLVMEGGTYNSNAATLDGDLTANAGMVNLGDQASTVTGKATFGEKSVLSLTVGNEKKGSLTAKDFDIAENATMKLTLENNVVGVGAQNVKLDVLKKADGSSFENNFKIDSNNMYTFNIGPNGEILASNTTTAAEVSSSNGGTANNISTASAWNNGLEFSSSAATEMANHLLQLAQNDANAYVDALTAVAPEVAPMVEQTQSEVTNQVFNAVSTRLTGGSVSSGSQGMSSGDSVFERAAAWVQGLYNKAKLDDTSKSKGFDSDTKGVAYGLEKYLTEDMKAGIGYAYSQTDIDGFMRDTDVDTHTAILYGEYKPSNWYVNGIATYGWSDYEEKKNVKGVNVKADYDVETFGLQLMTGYDMNLNALNVTPEVGLRYVRVDQDSYKDSADQRVSGHTSDIVTGVIGAKVSKDIALNNGLILKPEARLAATYDIENDKSNALVTLANGSAYKVNGESLDRFGVEVGAGLTTEVNDNVEVSLGYEGKFREDYQDHSGILSAKYKF